MKVKCFKTAKVEVPEVRFTALELIKELVFDDSVAIEEVDLGELISRLGLSACDCIMVSGCNGSQCVELFEYVKSLKTSKSLISPRPEKLLGLSVLIKPVNGKEVDAFYGSQISIKHYDMFEGKYVFEGDLHVEDSSKYLGIILRTDSGIRIVLDNEKFEVIKPEKPKKRKSRKRRRSRKKSKKKR
ncbi:MAG: hypothetical protein RMH77_04575 [Sulfolobales archaeon]|nr:hypothetical protein [Sulfolobales archaeon]MCX8185715.1 hypothetical protein [Sulfolobales archaeon]MDW7969658.1 hypothetical protein [Sulfolobales archaeon]